MARQRELLLNIERMRREMDELMGDAWAPARRLSRRPTGFSPRVDVYYYGAGEGGDEPTAVVKADLAGIEPDAVTLEIAGQRIVISGTRPVREIEGRAYQQVEIPTGGFRRVIELTAEVDAERAKATFEDGLLRVELPLCRPDSSARRVPIERIE